MKFYISQNKKPLVRTGKIRKFINYAKKIDWTTRPTVYLKVSYGRFLDNFGKMTDFLNDGNYTDEKTFWIALCAFLEDEYEVTRRETPPYVKYKRLFVPVTKLKKASGIVCDQPII
ncbi:MAG TPA: hypothetical protein VLH94_04175 [Spirochaetia bacterium]|nr:hypothetical protein [Spirochaetia bacterium]